MCDKTIKNPKWHREAFHTAFHLGELWCKNEEKGGNCDKYRGIAVLKARRTCDVRQEWSRMDGRIGNVHQGFWQTDETRVSDWTNTMPPPTPSFFFFQLFIEKRYFLISLPFLLHTLCYFIFQLFELTYQVEFKVQVIQYRINAENIKVRCLLVA